MLIGIGTDIVEIVDLQMRMERTAGFAERVFDPSEVDYCRSMANPWQHFAARFAAKEAVMKALGTGWSQGVAFSDIVVQRDELGAPTLSFKGETLRRIEELGTMARLSLSHAGGMAVAFVVLERKEA